jgi:hypothetical protein
MFAEFIMSKEKLKPFRWDEPVSPDVSTPSEVNQQANDFPNYVPRIVDRQIWEIAKRVKVDHPEEIVYWAEVVKLYKEMGGRIEAHPMPPSF